MKVNAITIRAGNVLEQEGKLWAVLKSEIMQPGKGAAVIQVEMRDVRTGTKTNVRYRTQEAVERVQLDEYEYQFLFADGNLLTFMNNETFEQITVEKDIVGYPAAFLQDGMVCTIRTYEGKPISVELPDSVIMTLIEADPVVKGQTASSSYKPAKMENGERVMVPPHIENGTRIVVRTTDGTYVERAKE
ncbi:MAG TPA: elongation factor P [Rhodospirillaceae bacterium]|nr:MAG: elongation factor P [Alphaproteobacteria bacterium GWF2_58_20]HAU29114.1 elongation factor P [Rhodospirillaceae bacterium]